MIESLVIGLKISYIFLLHFIADWALQPKEMSRQKSNKLKVLTQHVSIHFVVFLVGCTLIMPLTKAFIFSLANALLHGVVDWYLWRTYKLLVFFRRDKLIPEEKYKEWGFVPKVLTLKDYKRMLKSQDFNSNSEEMKYLKTEFKFWDDYWFSFMLGLDQLLHAASLVVILALLILK